MTTEEITKLKAGTTLDALVSEMMGYRSYSTTRGGYTLAVLCKPGDREPWERNRNPDPERYTKITCVESVKLGFFGDGFPKFSKDIGAAWKVVEKLRETYSRVEVHAVTVPGEDACYICMIEENTDEVNEQYVAQADAETAPLAIVRAALMAVERTEK